MYSFNVSLINIVPLVLLVCVCVSVQTHKSRPVPHFTGTHRLDHSFLLLCEAGKNASLWVPSVIC